MSLEVGTAAHRQGTRWLGGEEVVPCGGKDAWGVPLWMVRVERGRPDAFALTGPWHESLPNLGE